MGAHLAFEIFRLPPAAVVGMGGLAGGCFGLTAYLYLRRFLGRKTSPARN